MSAVTDLISEFQRFDDVESVPVLLQLTVWSAEVDRRIEQHNQDAIELAARYEALLAEQDAFFERKLEIDRRSRELSVEQRELNKVVTAMRASLLGAALRFRTRTASEAEVVYG